jgi:hypothetical protein
MSHHLDSPLARKDPRLNITDLYLFKSERGTVLVLDVNTSLAGATAGFHPEARYEFKIHLDDSPTEQVTLRFAFDDADSAGTQTWSATRLDGADARRNEAVGVVFAHGKTGETVSTSTGARIWAGRALDPFYLDLTQLGAVDKAVQAADKLDYGDWSPATAKNTFAGSSIQAIVIEIPFADAALSRGRRIAAWATTKLATDAGGWHPINRAGLPMMWPIFRPSDSEIADHANLTRPEDDRANYLDTFAGQVAGLVAANGSTPDAHRYGEDVARRILPDLLPYVIGTEASFGFAGINGRFLSDNAPEVMFSLVTNTAVSTGLDSKASVVTATFPFVTAD